MHSIQCLLELLHNHLVELFDFGAGIALVHEILEVFAGLICFLKGVVPFALLECLSQNVATHLAQDRILERLVAVHHSNHHLCEHDRLLIMSRNSVF